MMIFCLAFLLILVAPSSCVEGDFLEEPLLNEETKPVLLTNKSHVSKQNIENIAPAGQCSTDNELEALKQQGISIQLPNNTFGISFYLPSHDGRCYDGLLICYPGALDSISAFDVTLENFKVGNYPNNIATQKCSDKWRIEGKGEGFIWHGIYVYTKVENGADNQKMVIMQMSISPKEHNFGPVKQFSIHFGNRTNPYTFVTLDHGMPFMDKSDAALRRDFLQKAVRKGAFLRDFVGLWMLGLDILPFHNHNIELYTYRGCECTMEAWV